MLLRKLTTYSCKNRLSQAFHALGVAIRTTFLLTFISDGKLHEIIHRSTSKGEHDKTFEDGITFASAGTIDERACTQQEKRIKYMRIIANCVLFDNTVEIGHTFNTLAKERLLPTSEEQIAFSLYQIKHIKRFGT
jgi:TnpA family transposase